LQIRSLLTPCQGLGEDTGTAKPFKGIHLYPCQSCVVPKNTHTCSHQISDEHLQLSPTVCPNVSDVENMRTSEFPQRPVLMEVSDATIHLTGR
jgi:hypothetical protein